MIPTYQQTEKKIFEIVTQTPARFLYAFLDLIFLQVDALEWEYKNLGFENFVENVSQKCFEIEVWTHTRVPYSFPGQMVGHYEEVELSKTLENTVKLERPFFSEVVAQPLINWLLYSFLTQIFLQWEVLEKEYRKQNWEMDIVEMVKIVDKVVKNLTKGR